MRMSCLNTAAAHTSVLATALTALLACPAASAAPTWVYPRPHGWDVDSFATDGSVLLAASSNGRVLITEDLRLWSEYDLKLSGWDQDIVRFGGYFISKGGEGQIAVSATGKAWLRIGVFDRNVVPSSFVQDGARLVVFGVDPNDESTVAAETTDGINWVPSTVVPPPYASVVVRFGSGWVSVGRHPAYQGNGAIFTSVDGVRWTLQGDVRPYPIFDVARFGNRMVAVGGSLENLGGTVLVSDDAMNWVQSPDVFDRRVQTLVVTDDAVVVADGGGALYRSSDGLAWDQLTSGNGDSLWTLARFKNAFVAGGSRGTTLASSDGVAWTRLSDDASDGYFTFVEFDGSLVAFGGKDQAGRSVILETPDHGLTWRPHRLAGLAPALNGVEQVGGRLFGSYTDSATTTLMSSPDGTAWVEGPTVFYDALLNVAWNGSVFCVVSWNGRVFTSVDAVVWSEAPMLRDLRLSSIATDGSEFLVAASGVGGTSVLLKSPDGRTWTTILAEGDRLLNGFSAIGVSPAGLVARTYSGVIFAKIGAAWSKVYEPARPASAGGIVRVIGSTTYVVIENTLLCSDDLVTWRPIVDTFPDVLGDFHLVDGAVLLSTSTGGIRRSSGVDLPEKLSNFSVRAQASSEAPAILSAVFGAGTQRRSWRAASRRC